jgi:four helix bundle protein
MRDPMRFKVLAQAEELIVATYAATAAFPPGERFGLTAQMRRAAVSVGSNIVEGCHREGTRALIAFLHYALGSAAEVQFQVRMARRLGMADSAQLESVHARATECKKMLARLIVRLRSSDPRGPR